MSRFLLTLWNDAKRKEAHEMIDRAPVGYRVELRAPKRTTEQSDKMWAMLTDISLQCRYHKLRLPPEDWKLIFMDALSKEMRIVPNLDGTGFVNLGRSSSKLSKQEMSDLIELITAYGAQHGVQWGDEREAA